MLKRRAVCWIAAAALLLAAAAGCVCYLNRYRSFDAEVPVFLPETGESAILSVSVSARRNLFTKALEFREGSISFNGVKLPVSHFLDPYGGTVSLVFKSFNPLSVIPPDEATDRQTTALELQMTLVAPSGEIAGELLDWHITPAPDMNPYQFCHYARRYEVELDGLYDFLSDLRGYPERIPPREEAENQ